MLRYDDIREVHLELTTRCNAACPQCPRNLSGGTTNPALPLVELGLEDVRTIFPTDFVRRLKKIYVCGNYGDALVAKDTLAIFQHLRRASPDVELGMFTNGSGRDAAFWRELAKVVTYVRFSIDGLEDTNHLYRRHTSWARVMDSVRAFVDAGGAAEWDFIVFKHNEHQVDAARELARKLGFRKFFAKRTARFFAPGGPTKKTVLDRRGRPAYDLEEPEDPRFRNDVVVELGRRSLAAYQREADVACKALAHRRIYVSAEGLVFPCCWVGSLYQPGKTSQTWSLLAMLRGGRDAIDAKKRPLREIVEGPFFDRLVPSGWPKGERRLETCVRNCGSLDATSAQYSPSLILRTASRRDGEPPVLVEKAGVATKRSEKPAEAPPPPAYKRDPYAEFAPY